MNVVPFFVADRPMSLRLLKGLPLEEYPHAHIGIMAHANTSQSFQQAFHSYPCDDLVFCDAISGPCQHKENVSMCPVRHYILKHTIKMCDSGIFTREGATLSYEELFEAYDRMGVEYGIMIDVFRDAQKTLESAKEGLVAYQIFKETIKANSPTKETFKLVAVAQGQTIDEYIQNYVDLKGLGFSHIAIGGLLRKVENTVRFTQVRDEEFMYQVLGKLRELYPNDWLFALGCFSPSRLNHFRDLRTWGDYKGWIFQYKKRNETLNEHLDRFMVMLLQRQLDQINVTIVAIKEIVQKRSELMAAQKKNMQQLDDERRALKASLRSFSRDLQMTDPELVRQLETWLSHGLLTKQTEQFILITMEREDKDKEEIDKFSSSICQSRELKATIDYQETLLNEINDQLIEKIAHLEASDLSSQDELKALVNRVQAIIVGTEREHRFAQVRDKMKQSILAFL